MSKTSGPRSEPEPPQAGKPQRAERADAVRNRARVLQAARALFREHGAGAVTMDQVAVAAGVGKGTLFRRFGDKAGLAVALLDTHERDLEAAILSGPPPLGPGAEPAARLVAFLEAYVDFLDGNLDLVHLSETARPGARYDIGAYRQWHRHVAGLIAAARPDLDADYLAHALLAPLAADQRMALHEAVGPGRVLAGLTTLARSILENRSGT
ncbi:helix-turn-helix domain-containing protein [Actinophytocola sp.]|jgi:AcrR family transcriptional regulator|uniref:TetR/AcrR family transcriptional regulator n=1 Tax=Actinophytocola sp. TaxID=1872138 RepID=UPI002ED7BF55